MKPTLEQFKSFSGHMDFMFSCDLKDCPYPKFHLFEFVTVLPDDVIGYISSISFGESKRNSHNFWEITGWYYDVTINESLTQKNVPESKLGEALNKYGQ